VSPLVKPFSFLVDKAAAPATFAIGDRRVSVDVLSGESVPRTAAKTVPPSGSAGAELEAVESVPLIRLAWARSGDKGDLSNVGVVARRAEWLPLLWGRVTPRHLHA